jgi:hypothetical protein
MLPKFKEWLNSDEKSEHNNINESQIKMTVFLKGKHVEFDEIIDAYKVSKMKNLTISKMKDEMLYDIGEIFHSSVGLTRISQNLPSVVKMLGAFSKYDFGNHNDVYQINLHGKKQSISIWSDQDTIQILFES